MQFMSNTEMYVIKVEHCSRRYIFCPSHFHMIKSNMILVKIRFIQKAHYCCCMAEKDKEVGHWYTRSEDRASPRTCEEKRMEALCTCSVVRHVQWGRVDSKKNGITSMWWRDQQTESHGAFMAKQF